MPRPALTELERLERRLRSWQRLTGPRWMMQYRPKTIAELEKQIAALKAEQRHDRT